MNDKKDPKKDDFDPYDFFKLEQPDNNDKKKDDKNKKGFPFWGILLLVLIGLTIADIFFLGKNNNQLPFSKFKEMVENGQIVEVEIGQKDPSVSRQIWEIDLPKEVIIGCILRGDQSLIPRGDTRITEGDVLLIITSDKSKLDQIKELTEYAAS